MGSKKHRNHTHAELMEIRAADDKRRGRTKAPPNLGKPYNPGATVLFNPFHRRRPAGLVIVRAPLPSK